MANIVDRAPNEGNVLNHNSRRVLWDVQNTEKTVSARRLS
jgi:hypothetical protein